MNTYTHDPEEVRNVLQNLIEIARDGQEGYRLASEHVKDAALKEAFAGRSAQRSRFVHQLQDLQERFGLQKPDDGGSVSGGLHRAWMQIRAAVSRQEDQAILEEAERGEDAAVEAYRQALGNEVVELPPEAVRTLQEQAGEVQSDHDFVKQLRDSGQFEQER